MKHIKLFEDFDWDFEDDEDEEEDFKIHRLNLYMGSKPNIIRFGKYEMKLPLDKYFFKMFTDIDYDELCDKLFDDEEIKSEFQICNPKTNKGSSEFIDEYFMSISKTWKNKVGNFGFMPSIYGGYNNPEINIRDGRDGGKWYENNGYKFIGNITNLI